MALSAKQKQIHKDEVKQIMELESSGEKNNKKKRRVKGKNEGKAEVAKQMLINGFPMDDICEVSGLTEAEIEKLRDQE